MDYCLADGSCDRSGRRWGRLLSRLPHLSLSLCAPLCLYRWAFYHITLWCSENIFLPLVTNTSLEHTWCKTIDLISLLINYFLQCFVVQAKMLYSALSIMLIWACLLLSWKLEIGVGSSHTVIADGSLFTNRINKAFTPLLGSLLFPNGHSSQAFENSGNNPIDL